MGFPSTVLFENLLEFSWMLRHQHVQWLLLFAKVVGKHMAELDQRIPSVRFCG